MGVHDCSIRTPELRFLKMTLIMKAKIKGSAPSLISLTVSVDVKHHVYLLKGSVYARMGKESSRK